MDDQLGLVKADRMARSLSPQLARAQRLLSAHGLVEVRIGPHLLTTAAKTASEPQRGSKKGHGFPARSSY